MFCVWQNIEAWGKYGVLCEKGFIDAENDMSIMMLMLMLQKA